MEKEREMIKVTEKETRWKAGRIPIRDAIRELVTNPSIIGTVDQWAEHMGYSRSYFSTCFRKEFGKGALETFCEIKYKLVISILKKYPRLESGRIANEAGFWNERALRRFLRNDCRINISQLRELCSEEDFIRDDLLDMKLFFPKE